MASDVREEILEIAAFQDGECIGASGIIQLPIQLQAYSNLNGGEISLQVYCGERSTPKEANFLMMDVDSGKMQKGKISPRNNQPIIVRFEDLIEISSEKSAEIFTTNYPNPFNPTTEISFTLPVEANIKVEIFNIKGQKVKTLADSKMNSGAHTVIWNGDNANQNSVASGIYFYKLTAGKQIITKRIVLMK